MEEDDKGMKIERERMGQVHYRIKYELKGWGGNMTEIFVCLSSNWDFLLCRISVQSDPFGGGGGADGQRNEEEE